MTKTKNSNSKKVAIIITAAGSSTRIGGGIKKEYLPLQNGTVLSYCANTFLNAFIKNPDYVISDFIVTCPEGGVDVCKENLYKSLVQLPDTFESIKIVEGGESRQQSVLNGLKAIENSPDIVAIHDGARPFVNSRIILDTIQASLENGAAVPGITPTDTQKQIDENGFIVQHLQRSSLKAVQTPQCFIFSKLLEAHIKASEENHEYTDDTEIWGKYCGKVKIVEGEPENIKITFPQDLEKLK